MHAKSIVPDNPFGDLANELRKLLASKKDDDFKVAAIQALQALEITPHRNSLPALQTLTSCVTCYYGGDAVAARVLLFVSGALISDYLCQATLAALVQVMTPNIGGKPG